MRAAIAVATVVVGANAMGAQSSQSGAASWTQFRAPDSSFAIMIPAGRPFEVRSRDTGYVSETIYSTGAGTTALAVIVQSHRPGASNRHMPDAQTFCVTCLGRVVSDTTIPDGPHSGRWVLVDSGSGDANIRVTSMFRLVGLGRHLDVISARSQFGQSPSTDAGWFLDSFRFCTAMDSCPVISDGPPPWSASPFKYLPPTRAPYGEVLSFTVDLGQAFLEYQVDKAVMPVPGSVVPVYPPELKVRKVEGEVVAAFVVDTAGLAEVNSLKILKSTDSAFTEAVRSALPQMRFIPAMVGNKKGRQLVQQPFVFAIAK